MACHYWDEIERGSKRLTGLAEIGRTGELTATPEVSGTADGSNGSTTVPPSGTRTNGAAER